MRKSATDRMNDYDAVMMGVLEPILVLSVMAVSPQHRPLGLREGQRGDERDGCADRDIPEEPAAVADVAEPLDDQRSGSPE